MKRDRCYIVQLEGKPPLRVRAGKHPDKKTTEALYQMFEAAHKKLTALQLQCSARKTKPGKEL